MPFFTPKCPVDNKTKEWIEDSFLWFLKEFGEDAFRRSEMILPSDKAFPERIFANDRTVNEFLKAICNAMDVGYDTITVKIFSFTGHDNFHPLATPDLEGSKACGLYYFYGKKHQIAIDQAVFASPAKLVAIIAHVLGHAKLRSITAPDEKQKAEEMLTDLATVFFGMGIFTANAVYGFNQFATAQYQGWRSEKTGYIDEESVGYALALFAYMKGDKKPAWARFLETNPKHYFKQGLKYLVKTGDTKVKKIDD